MNKLNKVAQAWVKALRSGKIKQATDALGRDDGSRCCLGVLCDLAVKAKIIPSFKLNGQFLPNEVSRWAGLGTNHATYGPTVNSQYNNALWKDNDGVDTKGKSFTEIADIIESQPKGLFSE